MDRAPLGANLPERAVEEIESATKRIHELEAKARETPHHVFRELQIVSLYFSLAREESGLRLLTRRPDYSILWRDIWVYDERPIPPLQPEVDFLSESTAEEFLEALRENQIRHWPLIRKLQAAASFTSECPDLAAREDVEKILEDGA